MDCIACSKKICRVGESCGVETFNGNELKNEYHLDENQKIIQVAAALVDEGRAGSLSRIQEIIEFIQRMEYKKVGLAYCYGMEETAKNLRNILRENNIRSSYVSCAVGGLKQDEVNDKSCIHNVSCNPLGQAAQLNSEGVDFVLIMGICLGHDIILQRNLKPDFTTVIIKDRVYNHNPLQELSPKQFIQPIEISQN